MIEQMMRYCRNYFITESRYGTYEIKDGSLSLSFLKSGQYFMIEGSIFNDGVHQYPETFETSESFTGYVHAMAVPPAFLTLADEISEWTDKYGTALDAPYTSESFGGYTYSKATGDTADAWKNHFASRLNVWRKI